MYDKKRQLLDAIERVWWKHGDLGTTVRRVSDEGDTTSQTYYTYFGSKDAAIEAMYVRAVAETERFLDAVSDDLRSHGPDTDPRERLVMVATAWWTHCRLNPAHFKMITEGKGPAPTDPDEAARLQARLVDIIEQAQLAAGLMPVGVTDSSARVALARLHGVIRAQLDGFLTTGIDKDRVAAIAADCMGLPPAVADTAAA